MVRITFQFDRRKAIEAILYLSKRVDDSDIYGICKLLYLADKVSLERYGRFIFGESYYAMQEGATPSNAYDLLKRAEGEPIGGIQVTGNQVSALREANLDYLSESDVECLNEVISKYGDDRFLAKRRDAHDDAWERAWKRRGAKGSVIMPVESIAELFPDSGDLIGYLCNSD